jgi:hypothetical protein
MSSSVTPVSTQAPLASVAAFGAEIIIISSASGLIFGSGAAAS